MSDLNGPGAPFHDCTYRGLEWARPGKVSRRSLPTRPPGCLLSCASCRDLPLLELEDLFARTFVEHLHAKPSPPGSP